MDQGQIPQQKIDARTQAERLIKQSTKTLMALDDIIALYQSELNKLDEENKALKLELTELKKEGSDETQGS